MQINPIIVARTSQDLPGFLQLSKQALGYSISNNIDNRQLEKDTQKFYAAMSEFYDPDFVYTSSMEGMVLDFYHYTLGVVIDADLYTDLLHFRMLNVISQDTKKRGIKLCLINGSLRNFRDAVVDGSSKTANEDIRHLFNSIHNLLIVEGLSGLWSNYTRSNYNDSIILIPHKN